MHQTHAAMRVLIACEFSGTVRDAFAAAGCDAMSCDLLPSETLGKHYQGDVRDVLDECWDMMIAFPPCTYVCGSGIHWNNRGRGWGETDKALDFFRLLWSAPIPKICIENPVGIIGTRICKSSQTIQPYQFGHDASKRTCLWLKNLSKLEPTKYIKPRIINSRPRWANQTDSGQNKLAPSADRWALRSLTYQGIANAMAHQWASESFALV